MGTKVSPSSSTPRETESGKLGDLLYGRFSDVDVDSVRAVRDLRERERE